MVLRWRASRERAPLLADIKLREKSVLRFLDGVTRILHAGTSNSAFIGLYIACCALFTSDDSAEIFHKKTKLPGSY